ncbi:MAG: hypothetical protein EXQ49_08810 [Acidobacteria bacterium]|nr:hypothetical protein [Acidobacteriota bacterium]
MAAIGNLNDYVKCQMGQGMATGGGGVGGTAAELAVGFGIAQQMMQQGFMNPNAPATTPVAGGGAPVQPRRRPSTSCHRPMSRRRSACQRRM